MDELNEANEVKEVIGLNALELSRFELSKCAE